MWDGADGVALRLQADGVDTLLTVTGDGAFEFPAALASGASYSVTVAASRSCTAARSTPTATASPRPMS